MLEVRGEGDVGDVDLRVRRALDGDEAGAVRLQIDGGDLQFVGGDLQQHLARFLRRHDDGVADAMGAPAGERAHAVRAGVGVGGVDQDHLQRQAERLRRASGR